MNIIENIGIAVLISGAFAFVLFYCISQIKGRALGPLHFAGLCVLFLLMSYQSYRLLDAWDEKNAIEKMMEGVNTWADDAIDFVEELDKQNGGNGDAGKQIKEAMNNPLVQKGLNLFGIEVGSNGKMTVEMGEKLKSEYNWYMIRRICWIFGFMLAYAIFAILAPGIEPTGYKRSSSRRTRPQSSRNRGHYSRRR